MIQILVDNFIFMITQVDKWQKAEMQRIQIEIIRMVYIYANEYLTLQIFTNAELHLCSEN